MEASMEDAKTDAERRRALVDKIVQQVVGVLFVVAFVAALLGIFFYPESKTAFTTVLIAMAGAIIVVAVLPNVEEFGIGPKGVNAKLRRVEERLDKQSEVLTEQQRIINQLVIYSLAGQPYKMLRHIEDGIEYIYRDDNPNNDHKRWANF